MTNRITEVVLPDLTKEYLRDLELTVIGDILAILRHAKTYLPPLLTTTTNSTPSKAIQHKRASPDMTHPQF